MIFVVENIRGKQVVRNIYDKPVIDIHNIGDLKVLVEKESGYNNDLYIDFANISYIDSSGLGALIDIMKKLKENGKKLGIVAIQEDVMMVFSHTKVEVYFDFYKCLDDI